MKYTLLFLVVFSSCTQPDTGETVITKWQGDKKSAISITYDDGIINQFTVARPIMNDLGLPATFYIITGKVEGSGKGKFIGRNPELIIQETANQKTNATNFFERASLIAFTGTDEAEDYHSRVGSSFESGKVTEAYALMDEAYEKLRNGLLKNTNEVVFHNNNVDSTTWNQYKQYADEGYEIASHTVTHARLAVLDSVNLTYELEQSRADIEKHLGVDYTFSAECPYGTENERVMEFANQVYPALRNRMPEAYLDELNRSSKQYPGKSEKEYVQWQRGPLSNIDVAGMKSWVDTCLSHDNIWLVLVFHGVDGIGWEPRTGAELKEYFSYMKEKETGLWVATFADVTKYIRERKSTKVKASREGDKLVLHMDSGLETSVYDIPLTFKTYLPKDWEKVSLNDESEALPTFKDNKGTYVLCDILPSTGEATLTRK
ncbi:MAG: peptidoglycan/xylan/chitin deacetylase (PgdA/CDA1 family) [Psychromonas sp.]|jgi:peptidoglycan/xylan/chitin deacetylase (PgdA/CDA1 family)